MRIGTRIFNPIEVTLWDVEVVQITFYSGVEGNIKRMEECVRMCREKGLPYFIHPVGYSILDDRVTDDLKTMARWADLGLILHDVKGEDGERLSGIEEERFRRCLDQLSRVTPVSFENATDNSDILWFWRHFPASVTLDIGHLEAAGIDSVDFVRSLDEGITRRIDCVHIHRYDGREGPIPDHWPLERGCKELKALKALLEKKADVDVILEVNDTSKVEENLKLLKGLREEFLGQPK